MQRPLRTLFLLIALFGAERAFACSCAGPMPQLLMARAEVVAEVRARGKGTFEVLRVVRGARHTVPRTIRERRLKTIEPRHCCDRSPGPITAGATYWAIAPLDEPGARVMWEQVSILAHDDERVPVLTTIEDIDPAELRRIVQRWGEGAYAPAAYSKLIQAFDIRDVPFCRRGAYRALLISLTYMAWGNEDHFQCDAEGAARIRRLAAEEALRSLAALRTEVYPLPCGGQPVLLPKAADPLAWQIEAANGQYPCTNPRRRP